MTDLERYFAEWKKYQRELLHTYAVEVTAFGGGFPVSAPRPAQQPNDEAPPTYTPLADDEAVPVLLEVHTRASAQDALAWLRRKGYELVRVSAGVDNASAKA